MELLNTRITHLSTYFHTGDFIWPLLRSINSFQFYRNTFQSDVNKTEIEIQGYSNVFQNIGDPVRCNPLNFIGEGSKHGWTKEYITEG